MSEQERQAGERRTAEELDLAMDPHGLYREEVFTDRRAGTLMRLTPVLPDGSPDPGRPVRYVGQAQLLTPVGALPLSFEIPAASLEEAARRFGEEARRAVERTMEELRELRREAASSIVIPDAAGGLGGPGGMGPGGLGGGGKIQLP